MLAIERGDLCFRQFGAWPIPSHFPSDKPLDLLKHLTIGDVGQLLGDAPLEGCNIHGSVAWAGKGTKVGKAPRLVLACRE